MDGWWQACRGNVHGEGRKFEVVGDRRRRLSISAICLYTYSFRYNCAAAAAAAGRRRQRIARRLVKHDVVFLTDGRWFRCLSFSYELVNGRWSRGAYGWIMLVIVRWCCNGCQVGFWECRLIIWLNWGSVWSTWTALCYLSFIFVRFVCWRWKWLIMYRLLDWVDASWFLYPDSCVGRRRSTSFDRFST